MSTRKTSLVYTLLILVSGLAVGMVIASRLDLTPESSAQNFAAPPMNSAPITGALDAQTFRNVAKAQSPIVVNDPDRVEAAAAGPVRFLRRRGGGAPDDLLRRFFDQQPGGPGDQGQAPAAPGGGRRRARASRRPWRPAAGSSSARTASSSPTITSSKGATKIEVALFGEDPDQVYEAKMIGRDELTDSALIQLTEKPNHPLPEAKFGDSSQMAAGDWVMAIGNPFNLNHTVTVGVISRDRAVSSRSPTAGSAKCCRPTRPSIRATRADRC